MVPPPIRPTEEVKGGGTILFQNTPPGLEAGGSACAMILAIMVLGLIGYIFLWSGLLGARTVQRSPLALSLVVCGVLQTPLTLGLHLELGWAILGERPGVRLPMSNSTRVFDTTLHLVGVSFLVGICHK